MSKRTELLDFLTEEENARYVLDILQRADDIRNCLMVRFMKQLQSYLQERLPDRGKWEFTFVDKERRSIECWDATLPKERQYLRYEIQHWVGEGHSHIVLLLGWRDDAIWQNAQVHKLASVQHLAAHLKAAGFKKWERWFRYRYVRVSDSEEDFLASILGKEDRDALFREISDAFWPLVEQTAKQLADANRQIAEQPQE